MESIKEVLGRLCLFYGVSNNRKLSEKIDINYNTISTWVKRGSIPYDKLHNIVQRESISFDWLLTGKGQMHPEEPANSSSVAINNSVGNVVNSTVSGGIHINTNDFNHSEDIKEIIELLKFAPSGFLTILKNKLLSFKELAQF
jgi:ribosomal protein S16